MDVPVLIFSVTPNIAGAIVTSKLREKPLPCTGKSPSWLHVSPIQDAAGALVHQPYKGTAVGDIRTKPSQR